MWLWLKYTPSQPRPLRSVPDFPFGHLDVPRIVHTKEQSQSQGCEQHSTGFCCNASVLCHYPERKETCDKKTHSEGFIMNNMSVIIQGIWSYEDSTIVFNWWTRVVDQPQFSCSWPIIFFTKTLYHLELWNSSGCITSIGILQCCSENQLYANHEWSYYCKDKVLYSSVLHEGCKFSLDTPDSISWCGSVNKGCKKHKWS